MLYNIFISHSWSYTNAYERLVDLLNSRSDFSYKNFSVPKDDPIHNAGNAYMLRDAIQRQMRPASCVLILAGVYATYSRWINIEIDLARQMGKTIIAIEPWGAERTSAVVKQAADITVGWNTNSVIDAIRYYCK